MSEMIERVATVFANAGLDGCETTDLGGSIRACVGKCLCRETARLAIEAMREPIASMLDAACEGMPDPETMALHRIDATDQWRAMIDAALVAEPSSSSRS